MTHRSGRGTKMYIEDNPELTIHAVDCVPFNRSKNAWTNGVVAYQKTTTTSSEKIVGWFYPPRLRNKNHHGRTSPRKIVDRIAHLEEE